jgi:hypothetical protein
MAEMGINSLIKAKESNQPHQKMMLQLSRNIEINPTKGLGKKFNIRGYSKFFLLS